MNLIVGIHSDKVTHANGEVQSFSARWTELARNRGFEVAELNAESPDFFRKLAPCAAFMWRFGYSALELELAKRTVHAVEHGKGIPVFPSVKTAWHFEDKISQHFLLTAAGYPVPDTDVFWSLEDAMRYCDSARYPFVAKLSNGYQSRNVTLVRNRDEGREIVQRMFRSAVLTIEKSPSRITRLLGRKLLPLKIMLEDLYPQGLQSGYFLVQEFLPGNEYDQRITVIGRRAYGFRRMNRPGDFRASGSGRIDWNPDAIDERAIRLAFDIADRLGVQSLAVDVLKRGDELVIAEISYTYAAWALRDCPGHWELSGNPYSGTLHWVGGKLRPEDAIFDDFFAYLSRTRTNGGINIELARRDIHQSTR